MDQKGFSEIDSLCDQSLILCYKDIAEAEQMAEESLDKSEQLNYYKGIINARIVLCSMEIFKGNTDLVRDRIGLIEEDLILHASPDECLMRLSYIRGLYFLKERNFKDSFDAFSRSGNLASRLGHVLYRGLSENGKGNIKMEQEEFDDAYLYYKTAHDIFLTLDFPLLESVAAFNLGASLHGLGKSAQSESVLLKLLEEIPHNEWNFLECAVLNQLGAIMLEQNRLDLAEIYIDQGIQKSRNIFNHDVITSLVYEKARLLILQGDALQAEDILKEFAAAHSSLRHKSLYYQLRAEILELREDFRESLKYYKRFLKEKEKSHGEDITKSILQQENRQLKESNHQLRLISTIGQELVANLDLGRILNLIFAQMNVLMPVDLLLVALVEGESIHVKFALKNGKRFKPVTIPVQEQNSLLAWSVRNRKEVFIRNHMEDAVQYISSPMNFEEEYGKEDMHSVLCIPLWYIDEVVGVISVQSVTKNAYTNRDLENLRALGTYAGIALRNAVQTEKMNEINEVLKKQSTIDSLTGLYNRREMINQAKNIWRVCRRSRFWVSLIMIDLDHFKKINDIHGHAAGDVVLKKIGARVKHYFKRALDCACRYGGEELLIIAGDMSVRDAAQRVDELRKDLKGITFKGKEGREFQVEFSCGIYGEIPVEDVKSRFTRLTSLVDSHLYTAKRMGRNCTYLSENLKESPERFVP